MAKATNHNNQALVELDRGVFVQTSIPIPNHAALRAGFAGYTSNPRWSATKFRAWRVGRAWRDALADGRMVIRSSDSMLVAASEVIPKAESEAAIQESHKSAALGRIKLMGLFKKADSSLGPA